MKLIARTLRGLEWVAASEIESRLPSARSLRMGPREVVFEHSGPADTLLRLQTVDDLFAVIAKIDDVGTTKDSVSDIAAKVKRLDWVPALKHLRTMRELSDEFPFDVVTSIDGPHTYNRFDVENAVGAALAPLLAAKHLVRTPEGFTSPARPEVTVRLIIQHGKAVVAVRVSASPLHRRGYKLDTGAGTLHPPAAAALAVIAGLSGHDRARDPFCGDGTIPIEAGLQHPEITFNASDLNPTRVQNSRRNADRAGVAVDFHVADAARIPWDEFEVDAIVTNPPWNNVVHAAGAATAALDAVWRAARPALRGGKICVLADARLDVPTRLTEAGYRQGFATRVRLAGRVTSLVVASPQVGGGFELPRGLRAWHRRALDEGVVGLDGL
ncbi:MAG: methyltransferase [Rhodoglobus sp.]